MQLFLIRHPRPDVAEGVCYGRSNLPLAEDAALAAAQLTPLLPQSAPLFCSPLQRCRLLAEALHPAPRIDARLIEADFGRWEMCRWDAIDRTAIDAWAAAPLDYAGHGGESVAEVGVRVADFLADLRTIAPTAAIVVTHAGVMKIVCAQVLGLPPARWLGLRFDYGGVTRIDVDGGAARLVWHNSPLCTCFSC